MVEMAVVVVPGEGADVVVAMIIVVVVVMEIVLAMLKQLECMTSILPSETNHISATKMVMLKCGVVIAVIGHGRHIAI